MNLDYYKTFYYVALSKNFTKAAELLGNNQPNVTRSMNNLVTDESKVLSSAAQKLRDALAEDASYRPFFCDC